MFDSEEDVCKALGDERFKDLLNDSVVDNCASLLSGEDREKVISTFVEKEKKYRMVSERTLENFIEFCEDTNICGCDYSAIEPIDYYKKSFSLDCPGKGYGDLFDDSRIPEESERFTAPDAGMIFEDSTTLALRIELGDFDDMYDRQALCAHFDSCEGLSGDTLQLCNAFNGRSCETNNYENVMTVWHPEYCIVMNQVEPVREYMKNIICQN
jgi:hypothetical protein